MNLGIVLLFRLYLSDILLYLAIQIIPKQTEEAVLLAKVLRIYLDKVYKKK